MQTDSQTDILLTHKPVVNSRFFCMHCQHKWLGQKDPDINFSEWHCRKSPEVKQQDLVVIGNDAALRAAPGCKDFKRAKDD